MLDDIEHLPEHPPYFNEFPGNVRNMSFVDFSDILCDPYTDPRAQKTPLQSDSCYYQDSAYCASNTKASLSSDENQTIGDVQFNNNCCTNNLDVSSHPSVKQFSSCNTTDNMCNNNDLLCNSSESVCNNIDRMCSTNNPNRLCNSSTEQMCDNSNTPCNNANRIYNVSPPGKMLFSSALYSSCRFIFFYILLLRYYQIILDSFVEIPFILIFLLFILYSI